MRVMEYAFQHGASVELYPEPFYHDGSYVMTVKFPDGIGIETIINATDMKALCKNDDLQEKFVNNISSEHKAVINRL